jgi:hypothetical protein
MKSLEAVPVHAYILTRTASGCVALLSRRHVIETGDLHPA